MSTVEKLDHNKKFKRGTWMLRSKAEKEHGHNGKQEVQKAIDAGLYECRECKPKTKGGPILEQVKVCEEQDEEMKGKSLKQLAKAGGTMEQDDLKKRASELLADSDASGVSEEEEDPIGVSETENTPSVLKRPSAASSSGRLLQPTRPTTTNN